MYCLPILTAALRRSDYFRDFEWGEALGKSRADDGGLYGMNGTVIGEDALCDKIFESGIRGEVIAPFDSEADLRILARI